MEHSVLKVNDRPISIVKIEKYDSAYRYFEECDSKNIARWSQIILQEIAKFSNQYKDALINISVFKETDAYCVILIPEFPGSEYDMPRLTSFILQNFGTIKPNLKWEQLQIEETIREYEWDQICREVDPDFKEDGDNTIDYEDHEDCEEDEYLIEEPLNEDIDINIEDLKNELSNFLNNYYQRKKIKDKSKKEWLLYRVNKMSDLLSLPEYFEGKLIEDSSGKLYISTTDIRYGEFFSQADKKQVKNMKVVTDMKKFAT